MQVGRHICAHMETHAEAVNTEVLFPLRYQTEHDLKIHWDLLKRIGSAEKKLAENKHLANFLPYLASEVSQQLLLPMSRIVASWKVALEKT